jgi:septal ring factor EnvC (AmiA/AmiB activator)
MTTAAEPAATSRTDADRLARLFEAYKVQEEELRDAHARAERLLRDLGDAGTAAADTERVIAEKDAEIRRLQEELVHKDARIQELLGAEEDAKAIQMYKDRIAELEAAYAQEKERLAKLFLLYEQAQRTS